MSNNVTKTVKDLLKEGKAINLMTPGGFVYLSADQVEMISRGDITEINSIQDSAGLICQWIYPNC